MTNLLVTRPRHEITTNYLFYYAGEALNVLKDRENLNIIDLKDNRANKKEFEGVIRKTNPALIFLNGHGNPTSVNGHDDKPVVKLGENEQVLHKKIVYALSCNSAEKLGSHCVKNGTYAYIGYKESFIFVYEENNVSRPLNDKTARLFLEPSNHLVVSLAKGNTAIEAYKKSQKYFKKNIRKLITSESPQADKSNLPWLLWDMQHQVCLGKENAKITT